MRAKLATLTLALVGLLAGPLMMAAHACGGFFCNTTPIDQSGEKILFIREENQMTTYVQIQYQGAAKDFSWVVPVPAQPTLSVSSDEVFTRLERATKVSYTLNMGNTDGTCKSDFNFGMAMPGSTAPRANDAAGAVLVSQQQVGPYDSAILKADSVADLQKWLDDNHYTTPPRFAEVTRTYLKAGNYFVALKLRQDKDTGDLAPIVLSYHFNEPCIPLILTSIAARPDMPITAYVLGPARAVPTNYRHVQINESLIDWLGRGQNYNALVTKAVDEAGGKAFVTDLAAKSSTIQPSLKSTYDLAAFHGGMSVNDAYTMVYQQGFPQGSQLQSILDHYHIDYSSSTATLDDATVTSLKTDLDTTFVTPLKTAYDAFGRVPYLTRFYTTMSPDEMDVDPILDYNKDLPDVTNARSADGTLLCNSNLYSYQAPVRVTLKDGTTFVVARNQPVNAPGMPVAQVIEQLSPTDPPNILTDNRGKIRNLLVQFASAVQVVGAAEKAAGVGPGCSCGNPGAARVPFQEGSGEAGVYCLAFLGMAGYLRRRRS